MPKYQWSIEEIKRHRKYYEHLLTRKNISLEERNEIMEKINDFKEMEQIAIEKYHTFPQIKRIKYVDKEKYLPITTRDNFFYIHPQVQKIMLDAISSLGEVVDTYDNIELPQVNLTEEELVNMELEFAEWVPDKKYKKIVEHYISEKRHLLHFTQAINQEEKGLTYLFYYPKYRPYFLINREKTIEDFYTLNHEIAHGVFYKFDNPALLYSNHFYLTETEGNFFEFLTKEYLKESQDRKIIQELEYGRIINNYQDLINFYLTSSAIDLYLKENKISPEKIIKKIVEDKLKLQIDEGILMTALQQRPRDTAKYAISFLTSLDLENIYESDPEYAFHLLKRIRNNKTENIFQNLRENNITFIDDGNKNWKKKIKMLDTREKLPLK